MHILINTHQYTYKHIHATVTNIFNTYQYNVIHINTQYILIHAIHTNTCNKYQYKPYMPILTIHTDTHQYTPIQIQTDICNAYRYMQYKEIQADTYQYTIHANICKYIWIHTNTYHTYQYMHLYSIPNTNKIHSILLRTQYMSSLYWVCIELSIEKLEFNTTNTYLENQESFLRCFQFCSALFNSQFPFSSCSCFISLLFVNCTMYKCWILDIWPRPFDPPISRLASTNPRKHNLSCRTAHPVLCFVLHLPSVGSENARWTPSGIH